MVSRIARPVGGHANYFRRQNFPFGAWITKQKTLLALCLNRADGKEIWQREIAPGFVSNSRNDLAAPSPVTDGKRVIFLYGSGDVAAFDTDGKPLWQRNLQKEYGEFYVNFLVWRHRAFCTVTNTLCRFCIAAPKVI